MILNSTLLDSSTAGKQNPGLSAKSQDKDAQARFGGILSNLAGPSPDASATNASSALPTTSASFKDVLSGSLTGNTATAAVAGSMDPTSAESALALSSTASLDTTSIADLMKRVAAAGSSGTTAMTDSVSLSALLGAKTTGLSREPSSSKTSDSDQSGSKSQTTETAPNGVASNAATLEASVTSLSGFMRPGENRAASTAAPATLGAKRPSDTKAVAASQPAAEPSSQGVAAIVGMLGMVQPAVTATPATNADATSTKAAGADKTTSLSSLATGTSAITLDHVAGPSGQGGGDGASANHASSGSKNDGAFSSLAPIVTSVTVETTLAPAPTLSPMQQIIDTVRTLTTDAGAAASSATPSVATPTTTAASRTMTLVLQPENLGTVTVRMQMRGNTLDLQLDVANAQTLGMLTKDKDALSAAMSGQDYAVGTLTLQASQSSHSSQGNDNGQSSNQGSGGHMSSSQNDNGAPNGGAAQGNPGSGDTREDRGARRDTTRADDQGAQRRARADSAPATGVYI